MFATALRVMLHLNNHTQVGDVNSNMASRKIPIFKEAVKVAGEDRENVAFGYGRGIASCVQLRGECSAFDCWERKRKSDFVSSYNL
ncbi:hypothetical protein VNO78_14737 [Psophocarpus tetragonolobus]|uniref:Uncharacterized protein n=1 Tax=Psophocarpus tetragonolobus TaxID=3891 RepID=A0AAN9XIZ9_PSOTE